jgi:hypothetical protein
MVREFEDWTATIDVLPWKLRGGRRLTDINRVPPNVNFQIDDCELDWTFEKESFDYIHIRGLQGSVKDWPRLLKQAYEYVTSAHSTRIGTFY